MQDPLITAEPGNEMKLQAFLELLQGHSVLLFGAGKIGRSLYRALSLKGMTVFRIWDNHADTVAPLAGVTIEPPYSRLGIPPSQVVVIVTVHAPKVREMIRDELVSQGFDHVVTEVKLINMLIHSVCTHEFEENRFVFDRHQCHLCPVMRDRDVHCEYYDRFIAQLPVERSALFPEDEALILASMGMIVHNQCNLRCVGCNHLRDLYPTTVKFHVETSVLLSDIDRILQAVDFLQRVVVVGGEAFLHPDLHRILSHLLASPRIGSVQIITNGSVYPRSEALFDLMANPRVVLEISGYADHLPSNLQARVDRFLAELKQRSIRFHYVPTLQWYDFGDFARRNYPPAVHQEIYQTCCFIANDLFDGRIHKCSRSLFGTLLGKIPDYARDYIDIRELPAFELRQALRQFWDHGRPEACQHCNGTSTLTIPAGVQGSDR